MTTGEPAAAHRDALATSRSVLRTDQPGRETIATVKASGSNLSTEIDEYLLDCLSRGVKLSTITHSYGYSLHAVLLPWCEREGITTAARLNRRSLSRFSAALRSRTTRNGAPLTENTVWTYRKAANQLVKWYTALHRTTSAKLPLQQPKGRKPVTLEREQIALLEQVADTERDRVIVRLLADSGMRAGELVRLTKHDLRHNGRRHYIRFDGKTDKRHVPITPEMCARLRALAKGAVDAPIFVGLRRDWRTGQHEALTVTGVRQVLGALALNAGVRAAVNPYVLRQSACRWLLMSGQSPLVVEKILGRSSAAMVRQHYYDLGSDDSHDRLMAVLRAERAQP